MKKKNFALTLAAAVVFFVSMQFFNDQFLKWLHIPLVYFLSLLAGAAFGLVLLLLAGEKQGISKKTKIAAFVCGGVGFEIVLFSILSAVNKDGLYNEKAIHAADFAVYLLFGAAICVYFAVSARNKPRAPKIILAALLFTVFFVNAAIPYLATPAFSPLNKAIQYSFRLVNNYSFSVDAGKLGGVLSNVKSNINCFGGRFPEDPVTNTENNPYEFIDYIQLMECTGGNAERDLFIAPDDYTVLDDYDFSALISSCKGILKVGAKPLLKLGNVPAKLSQKAIAQTGADLGDFDVNIYPPDDYHQYYEYIKAIALALVDAFTLDEVRSWRFGVLTEYENKDWFQSPGGGAEETMEAYCKLYDYTVQALIDVLGGDVFVGAHSMTCSDGLWDEEEFIKHCGVGTNYATGETGSRICYLAASYYEKEPGKTGNVNTIPEIMEILRGTAESVGLDNLIYGVDEG